MRVPPSFLFPALAAVAIYAGALVIADETAIESETHWAFVAPTAHAPPDVQTADWPRSAIDRFILKRLEDAGVAPVRDAGRRTLLRRVYFDLVGLPPSPAEIDAFVVDPSPERFAEVVDRLLASPQFGERWGRHWLDVVRFAESSGREFNFTYPHAWPYRDYVIDAFNEDKPYDRFLVEQVAGDLLPDDEEPYDNAFDVATGFLAIGPKRHNSGGDEFFYEIVDDQIDVTTKAFLGLTVACAKCHDHKFDPIPAADYYALAGIFRSTEPIYGTIKQIYSNTPTQAVPFGDGAIAKHEAAEAHDKKLADVKSRLDADTAELKSLDPPVEKPKDDKTKDGDQEKEPKENGSEPAPNIAGVPPSPPGGPRIDELSASIAALTAEHKTLEETRPPRPHYACSVVDREKPADVPIAIGGDFRKKGDVVPRGFLSVVSTHSPPQIGETESGRLALAYWLTARDNPLTARVFVNRVWSHLFGGGLVATVDNFGALGKAPTHPELLDTLAVEFMDDGWSTKRLVRRIVLSRAYQLSTEENDAAMLVDAENTLLWRANVRRLEAEAIRDAVLAVSGELEMAPPVGSTVTGLGDQMVRGIEVEKLLPESKHRSVYLPVIRDYAPEIFELFDFPSPDMVLGQRAVTSVPTQELFFQNSPFIIEKSKQAAERVLAAEGLADNAARVDYAYKMALGREATDAERNSVINYIVSAVQIVAENQSDMTVQNARATAWSGVMQALFAGAEFRFLVDCD